MASLKIEILNPKALQLIKGMQDLDLIKISDEPTSKLKTYLSKMRKNTEMAPKPEEIAAIVSQVRSRRNAEK